MPSDVPRGTLPGIKVSPEFTRFWKNRGRGSKKVAYQRWKAANLDPHADALADAWDRQVLERDRVRCAGEWAPVMPHTEGWINQERWNDEPLRDNAQSPAEIAGLKARIRATNSDIERHRLIQELDKLTG